MQNLKKFIPWIIGAIVAFIIYRVVSNRLESPKRSAGVIGGGIIPPLSGGGIGAPSFNYSPTDVNREKSFGLGSRQSQEVAYLQTWLNLYYRSGLIVDGSFGSLTAAALLAAKPTANQISTTLNKLGV